MRHHLHLHSINPEAAEPRGDRVDRGAALTSLVACYDPCVTRDDIRGFVNRDWASVGAAKSVAWQVGKRTAADDLNAADQLRQYVRSVRPAWPSREDRADDLRNHLRVSEALGAVAIRPR